MRRMSGVKRFINTGNVLDRTEVSLPVVEIVGNRRVLIERHCGVIGYSDNEVVIKLADGELRIVGCKLQIAEMSKSQLVIMGTIHSVLLQRR